MGKQLIYLLFMLPYFSCNVRIYTNGQFSHKKRGLTTKWKSTNVSCLVFAEEEIVPDSAVIINETKLLSPFVWFTGHPGHEIMINRARDEASRVGANTIKVTEEGTTKFTRYRVMTKMYMLKEPWLSIYKSQVDSINQVNRHYALVDISSYTPIRLGSAPIYFNDSLVGSCPAPTRTKAWGAQIHHLDLRFTSPGLLSARINGKSRYKAGVMLEIGKFYHFDILLGKHGNYFDK